MVFDFVLGCFNSSEHTCLALSDDIFMSSRVWTSICCHHLTDWSKTLQAL